MSDHISDNNHSLLSQLRKDVALPDFVKEATVFTEEDVRQLPMSCFADPHSKKYPIHTKADTWLSIAYHHKYGNASNKMVIEEMLSKAAKLWEIDEEGLKTVIDSSLEKNAAVGESYTVDYTHDTESLCSAQISDEDDFYKVASDIVDNKTKYTYPIRRNVSRQLLDIAPKLHIEAANAVFTQLNKTAGYGVTSSANALKSVLKRVRVCRNKYPMWSDKLARLEVEIPKVSKHGLVPPQYLDKIAVMLDFVDRAVGIQERYTEGYNVPEEELFTYTAKEAKEFKENAIELPNGTYTTRNKILDNNKELKGLFSTHFNLKTASNEELFENIPKLTGPQADSVSSFLDKQ